MNTPIDNAIDNFHSHLDQCQQCRENPFALCTTGKASVLTVEAIRRGVLVAQMDDPELLEWLANAEQRGGGFISRLAGAGLRADEANYVFIRPVILQMREKYPQYEPSEDVKREIRERPQS